MEHNERTRIILLASLLAIMGIGQFVRELGRPTPAETAAACRAECKQLGFLINESWYGACSVLTAGDAIRAPLCLKMKNQVNEILKDHWSPEK